VLVSSEDGIGSDVMTGARVACFATQGTASLDEARIIDLLRDLEPVLIPFDRARKRQAARVVLREIRVRKPDLVVMEGTGLAGGLAVIAARALSGTRYVVSSGDAVGPYWRLSSPLLGPAGGLYERLLCRLSAGYIGWSPYLVGRALTLGAPRAMTAAHWASAPGSRDGARVRRRLGIPEEAIVFGIAGSITWSPRVEYCYGQELVTAVLRTDRDDVRVLVVGDGDGRVHLERLAGAELGRRVIFTGRVSHIDVGAHVQAMDVASLPQSVDGVGSFRYTTKLSEYLEARVPVVTSQIPAAYDLDDGWLWRLPGPNPWSEQYVSALAALMEGLTSEQVDRRRACIPADHSTFSRARQRRQVAAFIRDILGVPAFRRLSDGRVP
jgi:hypothetical protein